MSVLPHRKLPENGCSCEECRAARSRSYLSLEPLSVHAGDTEGAHPTTCGCTDCALETMGPWFENPKRIARLYRWLELVDRTPADVADFIADAESWQAEYDTMCMFEAKR